MEQLVGLEQGLILYGIKTVPGKGLRHWNRLILYRFKRIGF